jgi:hypothetical protein
MRVCYTFNKLVDSRASHRTELIKLPFFVEQNVVGTVGEIVRVNPLRMVKTIMF